jgi:hypothetical protein
MKPALWALVLLALVHEPSYSEQFNPYTDKVNLKNGQTIRCDILGESLDRVRVQTLNSSVMDIARERITSIEKELDTPNYMTLKALRRAANRASYDAMEQILSGINHSGLDPKEKDSFQEVEEAAYGAISQYCKPPEAISFLRSAIRRNPGLHQPRVVLVDLLESTNDRRGAVLALGVLIDKFPDQEYQKRAKDFVEKALRLVAEGRDKSGKETADLTSADFLKLAAAMHGTILPAGPTAKERSHRWLSLFSGILRGTRPKLLDVVSPDDMILSAIATNLTSLYESRTGHPSDALRQALDGLNNVAAAAAYKNAVSASDADFPIAGRFGVFLIYRDLTKSMAAKNRMNTATDLQWIRALATRVDWKSLPLFEDPMKAIQLVPKLQESIKFMGMPETRRIEECFPLVSDAVDTSIKTAAIWAANMAFSMDSRSSATATFLAGFFTKAIDDVEQALLRQQEKPADLLLRLASLREYAPDFLSTAQQGTRMKALTERLRRESQAIEAYAQHQDRFTSLTARIQNLDSATTANLNRVLTELGRLSATVGKDALWTSESLQANKFDELKQGIRAKHAAVTEALALRAQKEQEARIAAAKREKENQEEELRRKKEEEEKRERQAIQDTAAAYVKLFMAAKPKYEEIQQLWDPESKEKPQSIEGLRSYALKEIELKGSGQSSVAVHLRYTKDGESIDGDYRLLLVRRGDKWYVYRLE